MDEGWVQLKQPVLYAISDDILMVRTAELPGEPIEGIGTAAEHHYELRDGSKLLHEWDTATDTESPQQLWAEAVQYLPADITNDDGAMWECRNTFFRQHATTERAANRELAQRIYDSGQMLEYLCNSCAAEHVGDETAIRAMFLSYASTRVINSDGIHISISGSAGTGKSHAALRVIDRIPQEYTLRARLSDKALYYHDIPPGTVILMDDQDLTDDFQELLKVASTDWSREATYRTVNNGKPVELKLPARCPFWVCKANLNGDEQVLDRQLIIWTDESVEQKRAIQDAILQLASDPDQCAKQYDLGVCRALWELVQDTVVVVPFATRITCDEQMDPRNIKLMIALLQAHALLRAPLRERDLAGRLIAEVEDFQAACNIINPLLGNIGGSQKLKLSSSGARVLAYLAVQPSGEVMFSEIRRECGISQAQLSQALYGRTDRGTDGLLAVCPAIEIISQSTTTGDEVSRKTIGRKGIRWSKETYDAWSSKSGAFFLRV